MDPGQMMLTLLDTPLVPDLDKVERELEVGIANDKLLFLQIEELVKEPEERQYEPLVQALYQDLDRVEDELAMLSIRLSMDLDVAFTSAVWGDRALPLVRLAKLKRLLARRQLFLRERSRQLRIIRVAKMGSMDPLVTRQLADDLFERILTHLPKDSALPVEAKKEI